MSYKNSWRSSTTSSPAMKCMMSASILVPGFFHSGSLMAFISRFVGLIGCLAGCIDNAGQLMCANGDIDVLHGLGGGPLEQIVERGHHHQPLPIFRQRKAANVSVMGPGHAADPGRVIGQEPDQRLAGIEMPVALEHLIHGHRA